MTEPAPFVPPEFIGLEVTRRCNLRCPHCYTASGGPAHPGPSTVSLKSLHSRIVDAGIRKVAYSGGEPLVRRDLVEVMVHGRERGIEGYGLVTNGFYVTAGLARSLAAAGLTVAQVSLDGVDAADHCDVRACGPRDFFRAVRAIRLFRDAGVTVDVACLLTGRNLDRRHEMALFCEALGVRALRFCTFVPAGRAVDDPIRRRHAIEPERLDVFLKFMRDANRQEGAPIRLVIDHGVGPWNDARSFACRSGSEVAYVSAEGDLYPCPGVIFDRFKVGNVFETPLGDLLASPAMARMRNLRKADTSGPCATCPNDACSGGCRGASYAAFGDENHAPPFCTVYRP